MKKQGQEELNERIEQEIMTNLPPQEGGIDYKKQHALIEMANLAILDEIKRLDKNVKSFRKKLEQEGVNINDLNRRRAYYQQYSDCQGNYLAGQQQFALHRDDMGQGNGPMYLGSSLTKQHLLQLNR